MITSADFQDAQEEKEEGGRDSEHMSTGSARPEAVTKLHEQHISFSWPETGFANQGKFLQQLTALGPSPKYLLFSTYL